MSAASANTFQALHSNNDGSNDRQGWHAGLSTSYLAVVFGVAFSLVTITFCTSYIMRCCYRRRRQAAGQGAADELGGLEGRASAAEGLVPPPPPPPRGPPPVVVVHPGRELSCAKLDDAMVAAILAEHQKASADGDNSRFLEVLVKDPEEGGGDAAAVQAALGAAAPPEAQPPASAAPPARRLGALFAWLRRAPATPQPPSGQLPAGAPLSRSASTFGTAPPASAPAPPSPRQQHEQQSAAVLAVQQWLHAQQMREAAAAQAARRSARGGGGHRTSPAAELSVRRRDAESDEVMPAQAPPASASVGRAPAPPMAPLPLFWPSNVGDASPWPSTGRTSSSTGGGDNGPDAAGSGASSSREAGGDGGSATASSRRDAADDHGGEAFSSTSADASSEGSRRRA